MLWGRPWGMRSHPGPPLPEDEVVGSRSTPRGATTLETQGFSQWGKSVTRGVQGGMSMSHFLCDAHAPDHALLKCTEERGGARGCSGGWELLPGPVDSTVSMDYEFDGGFWLGFGGTGGTGRWQ